MRQRSRWILVLLATSLGIGLAMGAPAWHRDGKATDQIITQDPPPNSPLPQQAVDGVFPQLTISAPGAEIDSESGIGALIPWADRLWAIGYVAHVKGQGIGLYEISPDLTIRKHPESVTGTFANRMVHWETQQAIIGPHLIDPKGGVRTIKELASQRLAATARHLTDPDKLAYFLTMEGKLHEVNLLTLETRELFDLVRELDLPHGAQPHFKAAHTAQGRLVVANNTYDEQEFKGTRAAGRLAQWDGSNWSVIEENPFVEVSGKQNPDHAAEGADTLFALGWDKGSVLLRVLHNGTWRRYRLPKGGQTWDHTWNTEWMRIREVQTERYLMDAFGLFYELPAFAYGGSVWGIQPISRHLRICPDLLSWRGWLVLAGDQTDNAVGQPQSNLWFGSLDRLWSWGKPQGWGALWWDEAIEANEVSDPFLMTGFDQKVIHLLHDGGEVATFAIEVDFLGDDTWKTYATIQVFPGVYAHHEFPPGYSAHWVRVRCDIPGRATASLMYR